MSGSTCATYATPFALGVGSAPFPELITPSAEQPMINYRDGPHSFTEISRAPASGAYVNAGRPAGDREEAEVTHGSLVGA
jgi:hypothetical protein